MKRYPLLTTLNLFLLLLISGCESGGAAHKSARLLLAQTVDIEKQVDAKIVAENTYYKESLDTLYRSDSKDRHNSETVLIDRRVKEIQGSAMNADSDLSPFDVIRFSESFVTDVQDQRSLALARLMSLKIDLTNGLKKLETDKSSLKKIRAGLEELQTEPSTKDEIGIWFSFVMDTRKAIEEQKKGKE